MIRTIYTHMIFSGFHSLTYTWLDVICLMDTYKEEKRKLKGLNLNDNLSMWRLFHARLSNIWS